MSAQQKFEKRDWLFFKTCVSIVKDASKIRKFVFLVQIGIKLQWLI